MQVHPFGSSLAQGEFEVLLDGFQIGIPPARRSLIAIHSYLETLALERQRILCSFCVDGQRANLAHPLSTRKSFHRVEAETIDLDEMPLQLLKTARQQTDDARDQLQSAVALVLINDGQLAREFWWKLTGMLKEPLLTLSLLPDTICGPTNGSASLTQLRKWQLQQLAVIIKDVDEACQTEDPIALANALENRALPWVEKLHELICLWHETIAAGSRLTTESN